MKRLFVLLGFTVATALLLGLFSDMTAQGVSVTRVMGIPVLSVGGGETAWLCLGAGTGVLVVGIGGAGGVAITLYGAGLLFATGQLVAGSIAFGQLGIGFVHFLGQAGAAITAAGQVVGGGLVAGQVPLGGDGAAFFERLRADLDEVLAFR